MLSSSAQTLYRISEHGTSCRWNLNFRENDELADSTAMATRDCPQISEDEQRAVYQEVFNETRENEIENFRKQKKKDGVNHLKFEE